MKFIHIADVHLGANPDASKPWGQDRGKEIWKTLEKIVGRANKQDVDLLFISGGLFENSPTEQEVKEVNYILGRLKRAEVVFIAGKSDCVESGSAYDEYEFKDYIHFLKEDTLQSIKFDNIETTVYGASCRSQQIKDKVYSEAVAEDSSKVNILIGCGGDNNPSFDRTVFKKHGFDYVAFGNNHNPEIDLDNAFVYPGSLEPLDCTEKGDHGYIYGVISKTKFEIEFVPFSTRKYDTIEYDISEISSFEQLIDGIEDQINECGRDNIYTILLTGAKNSDITFDMERIKSIGNILEVSNDTGLEVTVDTLREANKNNLIGHFIESLINKDDVVSQKALKYGLDALIKTSKEK